MTKHFAGQGAGLVHRVRDLSKQSEQSHAHKGLQGALAVKQGSDLKAANIVP